jgi:AraC-like DNA-binding protein
LVGYLDDLAAITLAPLEESDENMIAAVRRALWTMLPGGRPDLWRTAAGMGVSARTLQRRLGEEGSSFSRVLDELRRDLSDELLSDRKLSVAEVAFLLGYSEPSAFQRAFRRWRGVSPRRFRVA